MPKRMILVAGNIGSGKTSLTERIGERLGWLTAFKSVVDNPYLADFYADMKQWSFHLQVFFLGHRAQQHLDMNDPRQHQTATAQVHHYTCLRRLGYISIA